ncbi:MAG TPA: tyrosine-type recombinase/integrase [Thermoanaerobaculia bacterium]|jgi:hypothetical protein|nr:tyrosine-type recombinase/integrase [Thermoanaerobaculia bacterium]
MLLDHHVLPSIGNVRLDQVTIAHLEDFVSTMQRKTHDDRPYSNATINSCLQLVRTELRTAREAAAAPRAGCAERAHHGRAGALPQRVRQRSGVSCALHHDSTRETERKHLPPNAQSDYVTYAFERLQWSKPLFVLALYTGLRRSSLRLLVPRPRHTFASTLASKGINSFTLRDLLGHTSTRTTERYARPGTEALEAVARALA